ncbi:MAG: EAL domain-containing protein [bacterium]|nr:EAL domain-containing protein [bacterium]
MTRKNKNKKDIKLPGQKTREAVAGAFSEQVSINTPINNIPHFKGKIPSPIVEILPCAIVALDLEGTVIVWNQAAEFVTGWGASEVMGTQFPAISRQYQKKFDQALAAVSSGSQVMNEELLGVKKDGSIMSIQFSSSPLFHDDGKVSGILATFVNQSEREQRVEAELSKGNLFIERVLDNLPIGLSVNTIDKGNIGYANRLFLEIYGGWEEHDFTDIETFFRNIYPNPQEREQVRQKILQGIATGDVEKMHWEDMRVTCRDGSEKILAVRNIPLNDMNLMISTVQDVTEQKLTEKALRESERRYQTMAEASPVGIFRLDHDGRICHVNKKWREVSGRLMAEVLGMSWDVAVHQDDLADIRDIWQVAIRERRAFKVECRFRNPNGKSTWVFCQAEPIFGVDETLEGYIGSVTDISRRKRTEEEIRQLAYYDNLTRLPNRSFFLEQLERAMATAKRNEKHVAVLFCDLDNFKDINDNLGHDKGDLLLQKIAGRLSGCIRRGDTLSRLGGDEFVLLLPSVNSDNEAVSVARKIQRAMKNSFDLDGQEIYTTTSIGIAVHPEDGLDVQTLLKHADMAMYAAKGEGRNRYRFFSSEMNRRAQERMTMELGLRKAIKRNEFSLAWQPQYCLETGIMVGVEALLRWSHPEMGSISPVKFIPLAEETGHIHAIGRWVLEQACAQVQQWRSTGLKQLRVAVNLSASQFLEPDVVGMVQKVLQDTGLPAHWLELEITESVLMIDADVTMHTLACLSRDGVQLAIDDFGTGYSSLLYLKNYPVNRIKIAKEFVEDILTVANDRAIAGTVINMAKNLEMQVIAEGVENEDQANMLREMGCHEVQGFHYSPPLTAEGFQKKLLNN